MHLRGETLLLLLLIKMGGLDDDDHHELDTGTPFRGVAVNPDRIGPDRDGARRTREPVPC